MTRESAREPADLGRLLVTRVNAGDLDGLVDLYEPEAVLALPDGSIAVGTAAIRVFYADLLSGSPQFAAGVANEPLVHGDLALTSTQLGPAQATAEVARRGPDGSWRYLLDRPTVLPA